MKTFIMTISAALLMALSPNSYAEVSFSGYLKRNMEILRKTNSPREVSAFGKKENYRDIASVKEETEKKPPLNSPPPTKSLNEAGERNDEVDKMTTPASGL